MKKILYVIPLAGLLLPFMTSAHEHASYMIGGVQYDIVIGSSNEPIVVDDKTGLDLRVTSGGHMQKAQDGDMEPVGGKPATGLEQTLKVELISGDTKKTFDISPAFGSPGAYKTTFYPTTVDPFSYRIFGTINNTPVDLMFTCLAKGATAPDMEEKDISTGVKQLMGGGGFGCSDPKESLGFPKPAPELLSLAKQPNSGSNTLGYVAVGLSAVALAISLARRRS